MSEYFVLYCSELITFMHIYQMLWLEKLLLWSSKLKASLHIVYNLKSISLSTDSSCSGMAVWLEYGSLFSSGRSLISLTGTAHWRHVFPRDLGSTSKREKRESRKLAWQPFPRQWVSYQPSCITEKQWILFMVAGVAFYRHSFQI